MTQDDAQNLSEYGHEAMLRYSTAVLEDRALPDFYDGLKPVQRRVLYTMYVMGLTRKHEPVKAAKVVGTTMSQYHPHGDSSIMSGLTTLVNQPTNPVRGVGNWGSMTEAAGAARYVNCHISEYGDTFIFNKRYMPCLDYVPNYDEKDVEPVVLPCLLPNLLLNGAMGIAVAAMCNIPPFKLDGILSLVRKALGGKVITAQDCAKTLHLNYTYGGKEALETAELKSEWLSYFKAGTGGIIVRPEYTFDAKTLRMVVHGFPPGVNLRSVIATLNEWPVIKIAYESTDINSVYPCTLDVVLKGKEGMNVAISDIIALLTKKVHYRTNVTVRGYSDGKVDAKFKATTIPNILNDWIGERIQLEKRSLKNEIDVLTGKVEHTKLMIFAVDHRKEILASLDAPDPYKHLVRILKITEQQATTILQLQIIRLSKMDGVVLGEQLVVLDKECKVAKGWLKDPAGKVLAELAGWVKEARLG